MFKKCHDKKIFFKNDFFSFSERTSHIIQIAAVHETDQLSMHVIPEKKISAKASEVTGVTMVCQSMIVNGKAVEAVSIKSALDRFIKYLEKCRKDSPVILVGHNIESYDCKVLLHAFSLLAKLWEMFRFLKKCNWIFRHI